MNHQALAFLAQTGAVLRASVLQRANRMHVIRSGDWARGGRAACACERVHERAWVGMSAHTTQQTKTPGEKP